MAGIRKNQAQNSISRVVGLLVFCTPTVHLTQYKMPKKFTEIIVGITIVVVLLAVVAVVLIIKS